jgi:hypothetical protein
MAGSSNKDPKEHHIIDINSSKKNTSLCCHNIITPSKRRTTRTTIMLSACASSITRASARTLSQHRLQASAAVSSHFAATTPKRTVTSKVGDRTAEHAWNKSCYSGMDYTISEDATVFEMVEKLAAYDVGCLVTKDEKGKIHNLVSYMPNTVSR